MVGGRADAGNEVLYRFEFPERPGALLDFLNKIFSETTEPISTKLC
jgi:threonine dehydratase